MADQYWAEFWALLGMLGIVAGFLGYLVVMIGLMLTEERGKMIAAWVMLGVFVLAVLFGGPALSVYGGQS